MKSQDLKKYKLPDMPGVYLFKNKGHVLYVGKATSLKDRVKSYFSSDLIQTRGPLLVDLIFKADKIDYIKTDSVLEAIILEVNLIKKYQPKYNTKEKDNKSFNYVVITKEDFPRILIARGREIEKGLPYEVVDKFGPFTSGESLRTILKIIRKIFPYRDRCVPLSGKPCFNKQLGLCPGVCDGSMDSRDYAKIIKKIELILSGKINNLKNSLKKEMSTLAKKHEFERAKQVRDQIFALEHIQDVAIIASEATTFSPPQLRRGDYSDNRGGCFRIEAYDAAHLFGTNNVGVMVVMEDGELKKSDYRKFKINNTKGDDVGALKEMLERRLKHAEWPMPDLIVLDGGMAQINIVNQGLSLALEGESLISIVAVTKDNHHKAKAIIGPEDLVNKYKKEILLINSEAHRFAIAFHRQKRSAIM
jgi:excinuclease ABC subunit C